MHLKRFLAFVPSIRLECDQILKKRRKIWDDVRREEIDWAHSEGVYEIVPVQEC